MHWRLSARRLSEIGTTHVFGVPGDYNMSFRPTPGAPGDQWVGTCNELNAAYAAAMRDPGNLASCSPRTASAV